jgi:hypothetical protein
MEFRAVPRRRLNKRFPIGMAGQVAIGIGALLARWRNPDAGEAMQTYPADH